MDQFYQGRGTCKECQKAAQKARPRRERATCSNCNQEKGGSSFNKGDNYCRPCRSAYNLGRNQAQNHPTPGPSAGGTDIEIEPGKWGYVPPGDFLGLDRAYRAQARALKNRELITPDINMVDRRAFNEMMYDLAELIRCVCGKLPTREEVEKAPDRLNHHLDAFEEWWAEMQEWEDRSIKRAGFSGVEDPALMHLPDMQKYHPYNSEKHSFFRDGVRGRDVVPR